jgi:hypothetical protein
LAHLLRYLGMALIKHIKIIVFAGLPGICFAQSDAKNITKAPTSSATDCTSWGNKPKNNRGDFLEYLRNNQGKKVNSNDPYLANAKAMGTSEPTVDAAQKSASRTDFYTKKRYNLFPAKAEQNNLPAGNEVKQQTEARDNSNASPQESKEISINKPVQNTSTTTQAKAKDPKINEEANTLVSISAAEKKDDVSKPQESGNTKVISGKKHSSRLKNKLAHIFSKKINKTARPNYEKCTTRF